MGFFFSSSFRFLLLFVCILLPYYAVMAENIEYHGGPIPTRLEPSFVGQRIVQIRGPSTSVDMSGLLFGLQGGTPSQAGDTIVMTIHILLVRKDTQGDFDKAYSWSLSPHDMDGVLDPDYCSNGDNDDDDMYPSPVLNPQDPRLALHYALHLQADGTNARWFPQHPVAWSDATVTVPGTYVMVISTCQVDNMAYADGVVRFRSWYGQLPATQVPLAVFVTLLSVFATLLTVRYGVRLRSTHQTNNSNNGGGGTTTERVVLWALTSMALQAIVLVIYFAIWNRTGDRPSHIIYAVVLLEVVKHTLTFGVAFMMSMGQGYSLAVAALGVWYLVLSFVIEVLGFVLQEYGESSSSLNFDFWSNVVSVLRVVYYCTDVLAILLILCFLTRTMRYLKRANQLSKLRRYRAFLALLLVILLATVGTIFGTRLYGVIVAECSFVAVLTAMACLWWPHPENRDYERVMQLPQLDPDGNELMMDEDDDFDDGLDDEFGGVELNTKDQEDMFTESETDYGEEE